MVSIFVIFSPSLDQHLAALSYNPDTRTFYGETAVWCRVIYQAVPWITVSIIAMPLIWLFLARYDNQKRKRILRYAVTVYLALGLGPGLIVNAVFKDNWGRPRPYQVLRDGKIYSPFWVPHFANKKDNSFPGGHASIGFFIGIPFLVLRRRKTAIVVSLLGGVAVGTVRILQGGHYLSDVVFAGIFVWIIAGLVIYGVSKWYEKV